jgi:hypothetical protein
MTHEVSLASVLRHADELASVEVDGEMVIYHRTTDRFHRLDAVATIVWALLSRSL